MSKYSFEDNIGFHLVKVKGAAAKTGVEAYRAVMEHDGLSPEETLAELAKETGIPAIGITTYDKNGKGGYYSTIIADRARLDKSDSRLLFNSDTLLKAAWPEAWTQELLHDQLTAKFRFMDCSGKGAHDSFSHPVTILS